MISYQSPEGLFTIDEARFPWATIRAKRGLESRMGRAYNSPGFQPGEQKATLENKSCKDDTQNDEELISVY